MSKNCLNDHNFRFLTHFSYISCSICNSPELSISNCFLSRALKAKVNIDYLPDDAVADYNSQRVDGKFLDTLVPNSKTRPDFAENLATKFECVSDAIVRRRVKDERWAFMMFYVALWQE